ncbi:MAG: hypothetical protein R2799_09140 [Crocinitomicaceae bacterium]
MRQTFQIGWVFFIVLFSNSIGFSQEDSLNNNIKIFYYASGAKSSEGRLINGKPEGYWKSYFENGVLQSEGNRVNGLLEGDWKFYTETGILSKSIAYSKNKKNGYTLTYDSSGTIVLKENYYIDDVLDSLQKEYYSDGCLKSIVKMRNGKKVGVEEIYAREDGRLITKNTYDDGFLKEVRELNRYDEDSLKTGYWQELYANGKVKSEGYFRKGKPDGIVKEYNSKGGIEQLQKFHNGEIDQNAEEVVMLQLHKEYYPNGKIHLEGGYTDGYKQGVFREFDLSGDTVINSYVYEKDTLIAEGIVLKDGEYQGDWKYYYKSGELQSKGKYENSIRQGKWSFYYENGKIEQEGKYKDDQPNGMWIWYYPNGQVKKQEYFRKGVSEGEYVEYDHEGNEIIKGAFLGGKEDGLWVYQYNDHYSKGNYADGDRDGKWVEIYLKTGRTRFEGEYSYGVPKGRHKAFYPNGKMKYFGKYKSGKRHGTWRFYREDGSVAMEILYKYDRPVFIDGESIKNPKEVERLLKEME